MLLLDYELEFRDPNFFNYERVKSLGGFKAIEL